MAFTKVTFTLDQTTFTSQNTAAKSLGVSRKLGYRETELHLLAERLKGTHEAAPAC